MATKVEEIKKIKNLSEEKNFIAMVGHTFLFNLMQYIKKVIDSEELGEIRYIYSQRLNLAGLEVDSIWYLWNLAPHDISILIFGLIIQKL